jgi:hypothetical protein
MSHSISILLVEKNGDLRETYVKQFDVDNLYKKCGFKKPEHFCKQIEWKTDNEIIELYAKSVGKSNYENKYEFPPPVDTALYFGTAALVSYDLERRPTQLNIQKWQAMYENMMGGFENISKSEEESDEEQPEVKKTKEGYVMDGFVVDDEEEEDNGEDDEVDEIKYEEGELEEEEYVEE